MSFLIYPAIDLFEGACVRLKQGSYSAATEYSDSPVDVARSFEAQGAEYLHLIDLSGARNPEQRQTDLIRKILGSTGMKVQVGGGIRTAEAACALLDQGADRVVLGSAAIKDLPMFVRLLEERGGDRITLAADIRTDAQGRALLAYQGWTIQSETPLDEVILKLARAGLQRVLCTDISRDGMMTGPNLELYSRLARDFPGLEIQASGGVSSVSDLRALKAAGARSVILGRALYDGALRLEEALQQC